MVLFPVMSGVNSRRMPNSLNWMVTDPAVPPPCRIGTGNSPPTRKLASFPVGGHQIRLGQNLQNVFGSSALMNVPMFKSGRNAKMFSASRHGKSSRVPWLPGTIAPELNCPVLMDPMVLRAPVDTMFTPNCSALERSSSANFTRSRICFSIGPGAMSDCSRPFSRRSSRARSHDPLHLCSKPCR